MGSSFLSGATRVGLPSPSTPLGALPGSPAPAFGYGSALGSMSSGAAASYTPYRHDSAAVFTGGGAVSMGSEATGDDAMWITVYGFTEESYEKVHRMISGHGTQVDFVRGQGNWFFVKFLSIDDAIRMRSFDGQVVDSGNQSCCMIGVRQGRHNFSLSNLNDSSVRDRDASVLFEQSTAANRLFRQPAKERSDVQSKIPFLGFLKGFVADLLSVAGEREP